MIDVFRVGVHLGMTTSGMGALNVLITQLTKAHYLTGQLNNNLGKVAQAGIAAGAVFVGWKVVDGIWHAIEGSRELNKQLEKTKQLGGDFAAQLGQTRRQAMQTTLDNPTSTLSGNVRLSREIGASLGHPDAAGSILSEASKVAALAHNYTGESEEDIIKNLSRAADMRGQIYSMGADGKEHVDADKLRAEMEAGYRALILGGGFIKSGDLVQMARQGGPEAKGQSPEAFYGAGTEAAIAMGAGRLGTAEMSLFQQFMGGTMTKKVAEHLTEAGLLKPGEWHSGRSGGVVVNPSVSKRFGELERDPIAWLSTGEGGETVRNYAQKFGVSVTTAIAQLFGRQTTQRLVNEAMSNGPQFERARSIYGGIPDVQSAFKEQMNGNLDMNIKAVAAAWQSFTESFSDAATPATISVLHGLTTAIQELTKFTEAHPALVGYMTEFAVAFGSFLILGGSIRLMTLALGPFASAIQLLVSASSGMATAAAAATSFAAGISALAGVLGGGVAAAAIAGLAKLGSDHETPEMRQQREMIRKGMGSGLMPEPSDGFGPDGMPIHKSSWVPGGSGAPKVQTITYIQLDGRTIAKAVSDQQADYMSRPAAGTSGFDTRANAYSPGQQLRA